MTKKATRKTPRQTGAVEVDPRFVPVVDAFANDRHVRGGKLMSSYRVS